MDSLSETVTKNLSTLLEKIKESIQETLQETKIGIAFSGGVDSTVLAKVCHDLGYDISLLTIGFKDSHDILFSKKVNNELNLPQKILEIDHSTFADIAAKIKNQINKDNLSWNENGIAFYYVSKLAKSQKISHVVTANGIDELFCGYNAYRDAIKEGKNKVVKLMDSKLDNEISMMKAINQISSEFGVKIMQPFLSESFINYAKQIPIDSKIKDENDLIRKHIIRELAIKIDVPEISATQRKKALQYGSLIHKALIKSR